VSNYVDEVIERCGVSPDQQCTLPSCERAAVDPTRPGTLCDRHLDAVRSCDEVGEESSTDETGLSNSSRDHENPIDVADVTDDERAAMLREYLEAFVAGFDHVPRLIPLDQEGKAPIIRGRCTLDSPEGENEESNNKKVSLSDGTASDFEFEDVPFDKYIVSTDVAETDLGDVADFDIEFEGGTDLTLNESEVQASEAVIGASTSIDVEAAPSKGISKALENDDSITVAFSFEDAVEDTREIKVEIDEDTDGVSIQSEEAATAENSAADQIELPYGPVETSVEIVESDIGDIEAFDVEVSADPSFIGDNDDEAVTQIGGEGTLSGEVTLEDGTATVLEGGDITLAVEAENEVGDEADTELVIDESATDGVEYEFEDLPFAPYNISTAVTETDVGEPEDFNTKSSNVSVLADAVAGPNATIAGEGIIDGEILLTNDSVDRFDEDDEMEVWISAKNETEYVSIVNLDLETNQTDPGMYGLEVPFDQYDVTATINSTDVLTAERYDVNIASGEANTTLNESLTHGPTFEVDELPAPRSSGGQGGGGGSASGDTSGFQTDGDDVSARVDTSADNGITTATVELSANEGGTVTLEIESNADVDDQGPSLEQIEMALLDDLDDSVEIRQSDTLEDVDESASELTVADTQTTAISYFSISHNSDGSFGETTLSVSISEDDITDIDGDSSDLTIYHNVGGDWTPLETEVTDRENDNFTLEATTDGFSAFAVALDADEGPDEDESETEITEDDDEDTIPGFGIGVTLLALIVISLVVLKQRAA